MARGRGTAAAAGARPARPGDSSHVAVVRPHHTWPVGSTWGVTPKESIEAECSRRGRREVVAGCVSILRGTVEDDALVRALGGPGADQVLGGRGGGRDGYWPRVWAARGLLHAWEDSAAAAIIAATTDDSWRVREMAARVVARHLVGDALAAVARLQGDEIPRVRSAADRAVYRLVQAGA